MELAMPRQSTRTQTHPLRAAFNAPREYNARAVSERAHICAFRVAAALVIVMTTLVACSKKETFGSFERVGSINTCQLMLPANLKVEGISFSAINREGEGRCELSLFSEPIRYNLNIILSKPEGGVTKKKLETMVGKVAELPAPCASATSDTEVYSYGTQYFVIMAYGRPPEINSAEKRLLESLLPHVCAGLKKLESGQTDIDRSLPETAGLLTGGRLPTLPEGEAGKAVVVAHGQILDGQIAVVVRNNTTSNLVGAEVTMGTKEGDRTSEYTYSQRLSPSLIAPHGIGIAVLSLTFPDEFAKSPPNPLPFLVKNENADPLGQLDITAIDFSAGTATVVNNTSSTIGYTHIFSAVCFAGNEPSGGFLVGYVHDPAFPESLAPRDSAQFLFPRQEDCDSYMAAGSGYAQ
jgi:hypothetical protein